ncbi:MAG: hypothetical protein K9L79_12020 [Methylobacter tundripaludum]|nr:hypothetical protein [Methylobacter tundripaludum]
MDNDYKKFGLKVFENLDSNFLYGTAGLSLSIAKLIKSKISIKKPPLDWDGKNWPTYYHNEKSLLWVMGRKNNKLYLPQSVLIGPWEAKDLFDKIKVELYEPNFIPPYKNEQCLGFYKKDDDFNGENARLKNYDRDKNTLTFQGASYFDWIMTNLSLDYDRTPLPTLRQETSVGDKLQDLDNNPLTNITGINGLLFSNDGYMIYQKRNKKVLVRPNQLCSGFSGTIDKIDIRHLTQSSTPYLSNLDTLREAVEEIGIRRKDFKKIIFLGITRELIRGGTPEVFYAVDLDLDRKSILELIPQDKEGVIKSVNFGRYARSINDESASALSESTLWGLIEKVEKETNAPVSIPFLTNLALWYWHWENDKVGANSYSESSRL